MLQSDGRVEKGGGYRSTDTQTHTHKGTLQLYIVDAGTVCAYVCEYVCACVYVRTCMRTYMRTCVPAHMRTCVPAHVHRGSTRVRTRCTRVRVRMHANARVYARVCACGCAYAREAAHVYVCLSVCVRAWLRIRLPAFVSVYMHVCFTLLKYLI